MLRPAIDDQWNQGLAIGKGRANDGDRKSFFSICLKQTLFAGNFVSGIVPVRISQRRRFGNQIVGGGCLIGAGGTDESVLPGSSPEQLQVALDVRRSECQP